MIDFSLRGGFDPLMMACERNDIEYVRMLLPHSKIDHKNEKGETCLSVAVKLGFEDLVKELIVNRADVNVQNKAGQSLVYLAAWHNHIEILRILIQAGADVNLPDNRSWTPLMISAYSGCLSTVLELLKNGADSEKKDCFGKKAIDRTKDPEIIDCLSGIFYEKNYPSHTEKQMKMSFSVSKLLNDKKRGQPLNQKKMTRSSSVSPLNFDVIQRRDIRGLIDDRIKVISKAYEFHVMQDWAIIMSDSLQDELQKAQETILTQQETSVKKSTKSIYPRLKSQLGLLVEKSIERWKTEEKPEKPELVKPDDIEEFYRFKFGKVSKEMNENLAESIINKLKLDMNDLQIELMKEMQDLIDFKFRQEFKGAFNN